jgi:hypothetical protein
MRVLVSRRGEAFGRRGGRESGELPRHGTLGKGVAPEGVMGSRLPAVREHRYLLR